MDDPMSDKKIMAKYIDGDYVSNNPTWDIEHSSRKASDIFSVLSDECLMSIFESGSGEVLEIGCGVGGVLYNFSQRLKSKKIAHRALGYDISPIAIARAKKNFGHAIEYYCAGTPNIEKKVSLILLIDVIEHVENLNEFFELVKGYCDYFAIRLPLDNSLWNRVLNRFPRLKKQLGHLHFFNYKTAIRLVNEHGLEVINYNFTDNFRDANNRRTIISKLMYPIRMITSKISQKINSLLWGGNSIIIFAEKRNYEQQ